MYKVIVGDDEPIMRDGLKTLIDWHSLDCELLYAACDGLELKDKIESLHPDIVISDIKMPGLDGIAIAKYLHETHPEIKLILLTAYADFSYAKSAIQYKVTDYVTKTGALEDVLAAVEKAKAEVRESRAEREEQVRRNVLDHLRVLLEEPMHPSGAPGHPASFESLGLTDYRVLSIEFLPSDKLRGTPQSKLLTGMTNFLDMSFRAYRHYIVPLAPEEFSMIVCGADARGAAYRAVCADIVDTVTNFMDLKLMLGVSRRHAGAGELHTAFSEARGFLSRYFIDQDRSVYYADEWDAAAKCDAKPDAARQKAFEHALQTGRREQALACLEAILDDLGAHSMQSVKSAAIVLLSVCDNALAPYQTDVQKLSGGADLASDLLKCRLLKELTAIVRRAVSLAADHIAGFVQNRNAVVLEADRYIAAHYCEDIELRDIAGAIHVNPSYLSRVYREQTGKTVMTTLNEKKIERAKECFRYTNKKVYEVAEEIGIGDTTYFSHFFKKHTGCTPREFRERCQAEQQR